MIRVTKENHNFHLINQIIDRLFTPEQRRIDQEIEALCKSQREITGDSIDGFLLDGEAFRWKTAPTVGTRKSGLHPDLNGLAREFLSTYKEVEKEKEQIRQGLILLVRPCNDLQDLRDALPNCITDTVPELAGLERTREPAWTIQGNRRHMRAYEHILPKLEFYSVSRLLY